MARRLLIALLLFIIQIFLFQFALKISNAEQPKAAPLLQAPPSDQSVKVTLFTSEQFPAKLPADYVLLDPTGEVLATFNPLEICLFTFASGQNQCYPLPEDLGSAISPSWSTDSRYLAFTNDLWVYIQESDLWLLDTTTGEYSNLTDDGVDGSYIDVESALLDYQPTWNPATGELYFLRTEFTKNQDTPQRVTLNLISVQGGEVEELLDVTDGLPFGTVYRNRTRQPPNFGNITSVSPDGGQMAVLVRPLQPSEMVTAAGIWLIDLKTLDAPRQLVGYDALSGGRPPYSAEHLGTLLPVGLEWAAGGSGLVEFSFDFTYGPQPPAEMVYYIDVASGVSTPLVDFSYVTSEDQFEPPQRDRFRKPTPSPTPIPIEDHPDLKFRVPSFVALSSDGGTLYMYNAGWSQWGVTALALPPDGSAPTQVYTGPNAQEPLTPLYSSTGQNRILLGSLLLEFGE